jgi:dipeptidyl aminopeptidase/acylaminoacyl peptidase
LPVRLLHGEHDEEVPLGAFRAMRALRSADVQLDVLKGGGHRFPSRTKSTILRTVTALLEPPS